MRKCLGCENESPWPARYCSERCFANKQRRKAGLPLLEVPRTDPAPDVPFASARRVGRNVEEVFGRIGDGSLATSTVGAIGELRASADLMLRGYCVFRAVTPGAPCDLVALKDGIMTRVEVTAGRRVGETKRLIYTAHRKDLYDLLVVVSADEIVYLPPLD